MERQEIAGRLNFYRGLVIIYSVGVAGHLLSYTRPLMITLTPFVLLITALMVISDPLYNVRKKVLGWLLLSGTTGFMAEVAGVKTGLVFGHYSYGEIMGPCLLGVPLVIGVNWMSLMFGSVRLAEMTFSTVPVRVLAASFTMVVLDFFMEPVAMRLGYWRWPGDVVPVQNYAGWFVISFMLSLVYFSAGVEDRSRFPAFFMGVILVYFLLLRVLLPLTM